MYAMGQVESGGNYTARNASSGAYGKYQIMPSNWPSWALRYLGDASAKPTPANQEIVAAGKFRSLYASLDSWRRVAYWWLTGSSQATGWSPYATSYVSKVMTVYRSTAAAPQRPQRQRTEADGRGRSTATCRGRREGPPPIATPRRARRSPTAARGDRPAISGYAGDAVRYATRAGASRPVHVHRHEGRLVRPGRPDAWQGEDPRSTGRIVETVDLYAVPSRRAKAVFSKTWTTAGAHSLTIQVLGTAGPPVRRDRWLHGRRLD